MTVRTRVTCVVSSPPISFTDHRPPPTCLNLLMQLRWCRRKPRGRVLFFKKVTWSPQRRQRSVWCLSPWCTVWSRFCSLMFWRRSGKTVRLASRSQDSLYEGGVNLCLIWIYSFKHMGAKSSMGEESRTARCRTWPRCRTTRTVMCVEDSSSMKNLCWLLHIAKSE